MGFYMGIMQMTFLSLTSQQVTHSYELYKKYVFLVMLN